MKKQKAIGIKLPESKVSEELNNYINDGYVITNLNIYPVKSLAGKSYVYLHFIGEK